MPRYIITAVERTVLNNKSFTITANSIISSISSSTIISSSWPLSIQNVQHYCLVRKLRISKINWVACYCSFTSLCAYTNSCAYKLWIFFNLLLQFKNLERPKDGYVKILSEISFLLKIILQEKTRCPTSLDSECDGSRRLRKVYKYLLVEKTWYPTRPES
jgi:hypothetical protein